MAATLGVGRQDASALLPNEAFMMTVFKAPRKRGVVNTKKAPATVFYTNRKNFPQFDNHLRARKAVYKYENIIFGYLQRGF